MRKSKFSLVALLAVCTGLTGCDLLDSVFKRKDDSQQSSTVTIKKVELGNFRTSYRISEEIPWADLTITASYSDGSSKSFTGDKLEFDVESAKTGTEMVVFTDGLHAQEDLVEGDYEFKAAFVANLTKKYSLGTVTIGSIPTDKFELISFSDPENIVRYKSAKSQTGEAAFKNTSEVFTVGTLNEFKFEPVAVFKDKKTQAVAASTIYEKKISLIEGETAAEFATYAEIVNGNIKFKSAAEGKSFNLVVEPKDFPKTSTNQTAKVELPIKVEKGLNVYTAKELGALNLTKYTQADYDLPASRYVAHHGLIHDNGVYEVFWDNESSGLTFIDTTATWKSFLQDSGTFSADQLVAYRDVPAVFFQDDIEIKKEDIPSQYFIHGKEGQTVDTDGDGIYDCEGTIRDDVDIYTPMVGEHDVVINGNFFKLDSKLGSSRVCRDNMFYYDDGYSPDAFTGFQPGHSTLIKFCGLFPNEGRVAYFHNKVDHSNGKLGVLKNVNSNGHSSANFQPDSGDVNLRESMGSMIFIKNQFCGADYTNNVIKQYQIGIFADENIAGTRVHSGAHGADTMNYNTLIKDCRVFDCPNSGICNFQNGGVVVESSEFRRYGGAPLLNLGYRAGEDDQAGGADVDDRKAVTVFDSNCDFTNYITSEETYYKAVGASGFLPLLQAYERFLLQLGNTFMYKEDGTPVTTEAEISQGKMNLYTLAMAGSAMLSTDRDHYSDVILGFDSPQGEGYLEGMCNGGSQYPVYNALHEGITAMLGGEDTWVPLFTTDAGEMMTSLYNGDGYEYFSPVDQVGYPYTAGTLQGSKITFMLPVTNPLGGIATTLVVTFQLSKIA